MATSDSTNFITTTMELIKGALEDIGAYDPGTVLSSEDFETGRKTLCQIARQWSAPGNPLMRGFKVWQRKRLSLRLVAKPLYSMRASGGDFAIAPPIQILSATRRNVSADTALGTEMVTSPMVTGGWTLGTATGGWAIAAGVLSKTACLATVTATAVTGMTTPVIGMTYKVKIVCSAMSGVLTYTFGGKTGTSLSVGTTIDYITATSTAKLVISGGTTATVTITSVSIKPVENVVDSPLVRMTFEEFEALPNRLETGTPTKYYYERLLDTGNFYLNTTPDDLTETIELVVLRVLEDFDIAGNTPDFPGEWERPLRLALAIDLAPKYGRYDLIQPGSGLMAIFVQSMSLANSFAPEETVEYFQPNRDD